MTGFIPPHRDEVSSAVIVGSEDVFVGNVEDKGGASPSRSDFAGG